MKIEDFINPKVRAILERSERKEREVEVKEKEKKS